MSKIWMSPGVSALVLAVWSESRSLNREQIHPALFFLRADIQIDAIYTGKKTVYYKPVLVHVFVGHGNPF